MRSHVFLKQVCTSHQLACAWFIKSAFVCNFGMHMSMCVSVYVSILRTLIIGDMIWCDTRLSKF